MKKYSDEEKIILLKKLDDLADELGSVAKTSELTGVKPSVISALKNDFKGDSGSKGYKGNADNQYAMLEAYFNAREAAEAFGKDFEEYVPTSTSEEIYAVIRNCQLNGGLAVVSGDAGIGKSKAAQKFAKDNANLAVLVTANECVRSTRSILKCLCEKLALSEKAIDDMWFAIVNKLRDKMILIIDEAQHLPIRTIEALRAFSDYFDEKGQTLGVIFIGNNEAVLNFSTNKRAEFAQIVNRTKLHRQYYTEQVTKNDIAMLFPMYKRNSLEFDLMYEISRSKQAVRGARNLFNHSKSNENISYNALIEQAKFMNMQI